MTGSTIGRDGILVDLGIYLPGRNAMSGSAERLPLLMGLFYPVI